MHAALHTVQRGHYRWHSACERREKKIKTETKTVSKLIELLIVRTLHAITRRRKTNETRRNVSFIPLITHRHMFAGRYLFQLRFNGAKRNGSASIYEFRLRKKLWFRIERARCTIIKLQRSKKTRGRETKKMNWRTKVTPPRVHKAHSRLPRNPTATQCCIQSFLLKY